MSVLGNYDTEPKVIARVATIAILCKWYKVCSLKTLCVAKLRISQRFRLSDAQLFPVGCCTNHRLDRWGAPGP